MSENSPPVGAMPFAPLLAILVFVAGGLGYWLGDFSQGSGTENRTLRIMLSAFLAGWCLLAPPCVAWVRARRTRRGWLDEAAVGVVSCLLVAGLIVVLASRPS